MAPLPRTAPKLRWLPASAARAVVPRERVAHRSSVGNLSYLSGKRCSAHGRMPLEFGMPGREPGAAAAPLITGEAEIEVAQRATQGDGVERYLFAERVDLRFEPVENPPRGLQLPLHPGGSIGIAGA